MKVLLLANHVNYGGITAYLLNLAAGLHGKGGFEYTLASRGGELEAEFEKRGVRHIRLPLTTKCEVSPKVFLSFLKLRKFVSETPIDVIHANTRVTQVLAALLSCFTGKPYISTCHGYFKTRASRMLFPCWGKRVIAISDQVRDHLIDDFHVPAASIELIYNGVEVEKFRAYSLAEIGLEKTRLGLDKNKKTIGHIGRLSKVKGQKYLILAAEKLTRLRDNVQFLIIGDGEEKESLKRLIRDKGLQDVVFIRPSVRDTALALNCMDIFVMPSLQEGLGLSILEANAAGVAVAASRVGGIPTVVRDNETGLLFPPGDADSLVSVLCKLLEDQNLKSALVEKAKDEVRDKFSVGLMSKKTRALYGSVIC